MHIPRWQHSPDKVTSVRRSICVPTRMLCVQCLHVCCVSIHMDWRHSCMQEYSMPQVYSLMYGHVHRPVYRNVHRRVHRHVCRHVHRCARRHVYGHAYRHPRGRVLGAAWVCRGLGYWEAERLCYLRIDMHAWMRADLFAGGRCKRKRSLGSAGPRPAAPMNRPSKMAG